MTPSVAALGDTHPIDATVLNAKIMQHLGINLEDFLEI